ncbi:hypothetical protein STEG23_000082 [Scotinomys teguina]
MGKDRPPGSPGSPGGPNDACAALQGLLGLVVRRTQDHQSAPFSMDWTLLHQSPIRKFGAGKMAQWLGALTALPKDPGSNPSTHIAANNYLAGI